MDQEYKSVLGVDISQASKSEHFQTNKIVWKTQQKKEKEKDKDCETK